MKYEPCRGSRIVVNRFNRGNEIYIAPEGDDVDARLMSAVTVPMYGTRPNEFIHDHVRKNIILYA